MYDCNSMYTVSLNLIITNEQAGWNDIHPGDFCSQNKNCTKPVFSLPIDRTVKLVASEKSLKRKCTSLDLF